MAARRHAAPPVHPHRRLGRATTSRTRGRATTPWRATSRAWPTCPSRRRWGRRGPTTTPAFYLAGRVLEVGRRPALRGGRAARALLAPLGMDRACFGAGDAITHRVARRAPRRGRRPRRWRAPGPGPAPPHPAGGLVASVRDRLRCARFHLGDGTRARRRPPRCPPRPWPACARRSVATDGAGGRMGLTWFLQDLVGVAGGPGARRVAHGGGTHGRLLRLPAGARAGLRPRRGDQREPRRAPAAGGHRVGAPPLPGPRRAQARARLPRSETEAGALRRPSTPARSPRATWSCGCATAAWCCRCSRRGASRSRAPRRRRPRPRCAPPSAPGTAWSGSSPRCRTPAPTSSAGPTGASPGSASAGPPPRAPGLTRRDGPRALAAKDAVGCTRSSPPGGAPRCRQLVLAPPGGPPAAGRVPPGPTRPGRWRRSHSGQTRHRAPAPERGRPGARLPHRHREGVPRGWAGWRRSSLADRIQAPHRHPGAGLPRYDCVPGSP